MGLYSLSDISSLSYQVTALRSSFFFTTRCGLTARARHPNSSAAAARGEGSGLLPHPAVTNTIPTLSLKKKDRDSICSLLNGA